MPRISLFPALLFAVAAGCATPARAAAPNKPAQLGLCAACHGEDGRSRAAGTPSLGGQDETYLRKALTDFRTGARKASPMNAIAGSLQAKDIQALARWYATRPAGASK
jgi:cytochrome c553